MHKLPALNHVALDDADVPAERFGRREKSQHGSFGQATPKPVFRSWLSRNHAMVRSNPTRKGT
jgi:hypothetical protein